METSQDICQTVCQTHVHTNMQVNRSSRNFAKIIQTSAKLASPQGIWATRLSYCLSTLTGKHHHWRKAVDSGSAVAFAFVDFRKAFDSVSHQVLLEKLHNNFGVCDKALAWSANYLNGRRQYTVVNGGASDTLPVTVGTPQGSVLGPTLFSLCTNDLPSDDTTIYCIKRTTDEAVAQLNKALNELYDWYLINRLTPHPEKSEAMLISKTRARKGP